MREKKPNKKAEFAFADSFDYSQFIEHDNMIQLNRARGINSMY